MIEFTARSGPPEAMNCPAFICDACRLQVVDRGNVYWVQKLGADHHEASPIFVGHKGACGRVVEQLVERLYPRSGGWSHTLWNELAEFVRHLSFNAEHSFADDSAGTYHDHRLVQPDGQTLPTLPGIPNTRRQR